MDIALFSESASRVIVSTAPEDLEALMSRAKVLGVPVRVIGTTGGDRILIRVDGHAAVDVSVAEAEQQWSYALERQIKRQVA